MPRKTVKGSAATDEYTEVVSEHKNHTVFLHRDVVRFDNDGKAIVGSVAKTELEKMGMI